MDEFRKPYEYMEEKGISGFLLLLFFMLITAEPLFGVFAAYFGYYSMEKFGILRICFFCAAIIYILFSVFTAVAVRKKFGSAVAITKVFLVYRLVFLIPYLCLNVYQQIKEIPYEKTYIEYSKLYDSIVTSFVINIAYVVVFSVAWYLYLKKSKKVGELFPGKRIDGDGRILSE